MKRKFLIILVPIIIVLTLLMSIFLLIKINYKVCYEDIINENLQTTSNKQITNNLVLSIIKTESSFNERAKSSSDAYGLMQLQYLTAQDVAKKLNLEIKLEDLYNPNINIKLGINYLDYLITYFNNKELALLAYNAGLNKVKSWIENNELVIEKGSYLTPYKETTEYLQKVLKNEKIYNFLKGTK